MSGKSGSGTLNITIPVSDSFQLNGGGVLGVIAVDVDGTSLDDEDQLDQLR